MIEDIGICENIISPNIYTLMKNIVRTKKSGGEWLHWYYTGIKRYTPIFFCANIVYIQE